MKKIKTINFDMDGTIADLYGVENWLDYLLNENPFPYENAKVMVNMSLLARYIHKAQTNGIQVNIISWLSKNSTDNYSELVTNAKIKWLQKHLPSVQFDNIFILPYGTPKHELLPQNKQNILFDDEINNLSNWILSGSGYGLLPQTIFEIFKGLGC